MIRVLLVEDDARLAKGWERLFERQDDMCLIGHLDRADGLQGAIAAEPPDILVIDLTMPGKDPIEAVRELGASHPSIRSVVYSAQSGVRLMREVFDAGAWAYIDKLRPPNEMFDTLRRVAEGEVIFPPMLEA